MVEDRETKTHQFNVVQLVHLLNKSFPSFKDKFTYLNLNATLKKYNEKCGDVVTAGELLQAVISKDLFPLEQVLYPATVQLYDEAIKSKKDDVALMLEAEKQKLIDLHKKYFKGKEIQ